ncbi:teichoic acid transporter [Bifidobacterium eulemuris]|uniref:Teichoic acid transporter n=2 Tax=Bifidobacterium eulemuris TaxID=1765219 RepID=A0A261FXZ5_9BIFI|nr:teichoic acid transporter [Bifidobacterium eulemuris]
MVDGMNETTNAIGAASAAGTPTDVASTNADASVSDANVLAASAEAPTAVAKTAEPRAIKAKVSASSIPESDLSLADIGRRRAHPARWAAYILTVLVAIIGPYWLGRTLAVNNTAWLVAHLSGIDPRGIALVSWAVTVVTFVGLAMAVVVSPSWPWLIVFVVGLACEQFVAGLCILKTNFWYSTYVVYGEHSGLANAANLGILAAGAGVAVFAVLWVGLLVVIKKDSPFNVLTRSWSSFILFFVLEFAALLIVLFGGLLNTV